MSKSNFGMVIVTSIVAVAMGIAWYLEPAFGGLRMDQLGIPRTGPVAPSAAFLVINTTLALICVYFLQRMMARFRVHGWAQGASVGAVIGLIAAGLSFNSAQAGQPISLIGTDAIFMLLTAVVMGALIAPSGSHSDSL